MVSLVAITEDGRTIEIGTVGNEGFIGVPIVHAVGDMPSSTLIGRNAARFNTLKCYC